MATGSVRNSRRFRELAAMLKERLQGHDISLVGGEAEELLGAHVSAVAAQLRVTERTVLTTYMSEDAFTALAERFAEQKAEYHEATEAAEPVMLDVGGAGHVLAALGMAVKLAVAHAEETRTASLAMITDAADGIVSIGAALRTARPGDRIGFGGHVLVLARGILVDTIGYLRSGRWQCSCGPHPDGAECGVAAGMVRDLHRIGGWLPEDATGQS